jgi:hypothetical protein
MQGIWDIFTIGGRRRSEGQGTPTERQEQQSERDERSLGEFSLLSRGRERDTRPAAVVQFALRGTSNTTIQQPEGTPPTFGDMGEGVPEPMGAQVAQNGGQVPLVTTTQQAPPPVLRLQLSYCTVGNRNRGGNKAKPKMASGHTGRYN